MFSDVFLKLFLAQTRESLLAVVGKYHAKVKWGLSSLSQGLSIYLSE